MRILLTIPNLDVASGGPSTAVVRVATELVSKGHSVALAYTEIAGRARVALPAGLLCVPISYQHNAFLRLRSYYSAAVQTIRTWQPDIVHDRGLWLPENGAAMLAARATRCALVSQPCGMLQQWSMSQHPLKKMLAWHGYQRHLLTHASAMIVTSPAEQMEADERVQRKGLTHCIPHGVDLPTLPPDILRRRQAVFMGRLHPKKQVDVLLRAWARLKPVGWQFVIAGSGDPTYESQLHELVQQLNVADSVQFVGLVQGIKKTNLLAESQLFLQPSLQENFGLAVAEAMAHGLPVLTTQAMPWGEVVAARCGWSVPTDPDAIQVALAEALSLPAEALLAMGVQARKLASRYCWTETAKQTLAIYAAVTGTSA